MNHYSQPTQATVVITQQPIYEQPPAYQNQPFYGQPQQQVVYSN